jgi:hypothetical protein
MALVRMKEFRVLEVFVVNDRVERAIQSCLPRGRKERRLWRSLGLELDVDPTTSVLGSGPASTVLEDDIGGCDGVRVGGRVLDEDEEEEEEEVPLIRKNRRSSRSSDIPMQALSGLVSLQGLTMSAIDHALEEIIPEDLLSEPPKVESYVVHIEVPNFPLAGNPVGQEIIWTVSYASSTLEGGLDHGDTPALDVASEGHPALVDMTEGALASECAAKDNPALEGGPEDDPAPKGAELGSPLAASMDVHVGSPPVQSEGPVVKNMPTALVGPVTLEDDHPDTGNLPSSVGAEVPRVILSPLSLSTLHHRTVHRCLQLWDFLYFFLTSR